MNDSDGNKLNDEISKLRDSVQEKLNLGRERLGSAGDDTDKLGNALISYHGALEDHIRASLVSEVPAEMRDEMLNMSVTNWKNLLIYGKQYLGLSQDNADRISEANHYRQEIAHGGEFKWEKKELLAYIAFIEKWCAKEIKTIPAQSTSERTDQPPGERLQRVERPAPGHEYFAPPWYRSTFVLWVTFLFLNPIWALLILTDKSKSSVLKFFILAYYVVFIALVVNFAQKGWEYLSSIPELNPPVIVSTESPTAGDPVNSPIAKPTSVNNQDKPIPPKQTEQASCELVWEEYENSAELANKNRSMVWEEIVKYLVSGTDLTARDFYDQVLERNPSLVTDGYTFYADKVYILPACK